MRFMMLLVMGWLMIVPAGAEVIASGPTGFSLRQEATSPLDRDELWERLIDPSAWWTDDHTYSGDASNLSALGSAGSYWREEWQGGSVMHGQVLVAKAPEEIVLSAPFGPLLYTGAECIWVIKLEPNEDGGTRIVSTHVVAGREGTGLEDLAAAVDFVMSEGIASLAEPQ